MTLTVLRSAGQVFCRLSSIGICLFFLILKGVIYFWGRGKPQRQIVIFITYQGYIVSTWLTVDIDLEHLAEVVFVGFSTVTWLSLTTITLSMLYCLKKFTTCSPHLKSRKLNSTSSRTDYLHKLFGIILQRRFVFSFPHLFIYSIIFWCLYGIMRIYFMCVCAQSLQSCPPLWPYGL